MPGCMRGREGEGESARPPGGDPRSHDAPQYTTNPRNLQPERHWQCLRICLYYCPMSPSEAYAWCASLARGHYENFPVASLLLPRTERRSLTAIYAFARVADDMADEGDLPPDQRLRRLDDWETRLTECVAGRADHPVFIALGDTIARHSLPPTLLADLLTAFRLDVTRSRYRSYEELLGYCRCSANPVGRLVLRVFDAATPATDAWSDAICTGLQLANFWQDLAVDLARGRIYLPLDDCARFGYHENDLVAGRRDARFRDLMRFEVERTRALFEEGKPLLRHAGARLRRELRLTWLGGTEILRSIERNGFDTLAHRPVLTRPRAARLLVRALLPVPL